MPLTLTGHRRHARARAVRRTLVTLLAGALLAGCTSGRGEIAVETITVRLYGGPSANGLSFVPISAVDPDGNDIAPPDAHTVLTPQGDGRAECPEGLAIATVGPEVFDEFLSSLYDNVTLAVEQFNAANPGCLITLKTFSAPDNYLDRLATAKAVTNDPTIIGVVGPFFLEQTDAMGDALNEAGLAFATPTVQRPSVSTQGWTSFVRGIPDDEQSATAIAHYLTQRLGLARICVITLEYPENIEAAERIRGLAGSAVDRSCSGTIGQIPENYDLLVDAVMATDADAVFFSGYLDEAAWLVQMLRKAGFTGKFIGDHGVRDARLIELAADASIGTLVLSTDLPTTVDYAEKFTKRFGAAPEEYAMETYELATIMVTAIGWGQVTDRASMTEFVTGFDGHGATRRYHWDRQGDLTSPDLWVHEVG